MNEEQKRSVSAFLKENVKNVENVQITLERFTEPFEIKPLTTNEFNTIQKNNTKIKFDRRTQQKVKQVDQDKVVDDMLIKAVVFPDFNDQEIQESYGTIADPAGTARAMLLAGEYTDLMEAIQEVSGFEKSFDNDVDEVKK